MESAQVINSNIVLIVTTFHPSLFLCHDHTHNSFNDESSWFEIDDVYGVCGVEGC